MSLTPSTLNTQLTGLVIARYGQQVDVETSEGEIHRLYLKRSLSDVVTGDKVLLKNDSQGLTICQRLPRTSLLKKPSGSQVKPIAANIDQLLLVIAVQPEPTLELIDDYIVMAEALHLKPIIIFNKCDLLTAKEKKIWEEKLSIYKKLTYPIIFTSSLVETHKLKLNKILQQKTSILVGQSGVGKSSIIKQLIPDLAIRIGELSHQSQHGKHTTTAVYLYHLPCGGNLIDSPGIRSFTLWPMPELKIASCFIEFNSYLKYCGFKDCRHKVEPNCAILEALHKGEIAQTRYDSYRRLESLYPTRS